VLFGVGDDTERGAVFDGTTGVHEFRLAQNFATGQFGQPAEPDQRGMANVFINAKIGSSAHIYTYMVVVYCSRLCPSDHLSMQQLPIFTGFDAIKIGYQQSR
jgi:hypothetical protein